TMIREDGIPLGVHRWRGQDIVLRLPRRDLDAGGVAVIGQRGSGKSTLGIQMNRYLIAAPDHPAVVVFDPNADAAKELIKHGLSPDREQDVVLLDLADTEYPVGLSLFHRPP